jgi:hypothetical protein
VVEANESVAEIGDCTASALATTCARLSPVLSLSVGRFCVFAGKGLLSVCAEEELDLASFSGERL